MDEFLGRAIREKAELDGKRAWLETFLKSSGFESLPIPEKNRLLRQKGIMKDYSDVLGERIASF